MISAGPLRLDDRLGAFSAFRPLLVTIALSLAVATDRWVDDLAPLIASYLAVVIVAELLRRVARPVAEKAAPVLVCVDGAFVIATLALTRGPASPLIVTVYLLIAVKTLLQSGRAGIGASVWCAFVLATVHAAADNDLLTFPGRMHDGAVAVAGISFVVFGLVVTASTSLSELGLRRGGARLAALVDFGSKLDRADRDDDVLNALVRHACTSLGFRRAVVVIKRGEDWRGVAVDGDATSSFLRAEALDAEAADVLAVGKTALARSLEPGLLADTMPGARNVVVVPVAADDDRFGVVAAEFAGRRTSRVPAVTVRALGDAAAHAGLTLRHRAMVDEIERLATRDALTGLANRRLLEETLALELNRARRESAPLSVVVIDVDNFKDINDNYGHLAGDEVLRQVGAALVAQTKSFDLAARYGGDEFVVVLPGCARENALDVAERLRHAVVADVDGGPVTVSAGVATLPDDAPDDERLLVAADAALYEAKRTGRDRSARPPPSLSWKSYGDAATRSVASSRRR